MWCAFSPPFVPAFAGTNGGESNGDNSIIAHARRDIPCDPPHPRATVAITCATDHIGAMPAPKAKTSPSKTSGSAASPAAPVTSARPLKKGDHVFLVDGSSYIFRAYHALPPLTRKSDGLQVNAVLGFCNMLWKL